MKIAPVMIVPPLAHDDMMLKRFKTVVNANGKLERRIVYNLCLHLYANGFRLHSVHDGDNTDEFDAGLSPDDAIAEAMNLIFNLDEASVRFIADNAHSQSESWHGVLFVGGNGVDCIADWNFYEDDRDGFNKAMDEFNAEDFE